MKAFPRRAARRSAGRLRASGRRVTDSLRPPPLVSGGRRYFLSPAGPPATPNESESTEGEKVRWRANSVARAPDPPLAVSLSGTAANAIRPSTAYAAVPPPGTVVSGQLSVVVSSISELWEQLPRAGKGQGAAACDVDR